MATKLFVGGLSWDTTDANLSAFFAQAGTVVTANVISDRMTGRSKGFGFVEMTTEEEAKNAIAKLNGQNLDGRAIAVSEARPQAPRDNSFSRNSGGGGFSRDNRDRNQHSSGGQRRSWR
jgi:RNA recognition motif-containing protein